MKRFVNTSNYNKALREILTNPKADITKYGTTANTHIKRLLVTTGLPVGAFKDIHDSDNGEIQTLTIMAYSIKHPVLTKRHENTAKQLTPLNFVDGYNFAKQIFVMLKALKLKHANLNTMVRHLGWDVKYIHTLKHYLKNTERYVSYGSVDFSNDNDDIFITYAKVLVKYMVEYDTYSNLYILKSITGKKINIISQSKNREDLEDVLDTINGKIEDVNKPKHFKNEGELQKATLQYLKSIGAYTYMPSGINQNGVPDILGCYIGKFFAIELKHPNMKNPITGLSALQKYEIRQIDKSGGWAFCTNTLEGVQSAMENLLKNPS